MLRWRLNNLGWSNGRRSYFTLENVTFFISSIPSGWRQTLILNCEDVNAIYCRLAIGDGDDGRGIAHNADGDDEDKSTTTTIEPTTRIIKPTTMAASQQRQPQVETSTMATTTSQQPRRQVNSDGLELETTSRPQVNNVNTREASTIEANQNWIGRISLIEGGRNTGQKIQPNELMWIWGKLSVPQWDSLDREQ